MIRDTAAQDIVLNPTHGRRKLMLGGGAALLATLLLALWAWQQLSGAQRSVAGERLRVAAVTRGPFIADVSAQGRVVAAVSPTLYAPALGTVTLKVNAGDRVAKGQVLAQLDSPEVTNEYLRESANLQGAVAGLERSRLDIRSRRLQNQQTVDLAKVTMEAAEREVKRARDAHLQGVYPVMEVDRRADELVTAKVRYQNAVEVAALQNESLDFELKTHALEVDRQRLLADNLKRRVDELNVLAPVDGVVGTLNIAQRAAVAANQPLMTVVDLTALEVDIQVPETYADSLGLDMPAEVRLGSSTYAGKLAAVSPEVNNSLVTGRVRFDGKAPSELRQNQRVSVRLVLDSRDNIVQVARGPFLDSGGGRYAYVVRDGIATRTPIRIGAASASQVEIVEGLKTGDEIVISGSDAFADADTIRIR